MTTGLPQFTFRESEVTSPCLTSHTYSLLSEQRRDGIGKTAQIFPLLPGIEPGTHTAIQNLFKHKNLARWFVTLQNYEINFEYIPGKKNTAADALSRNIPSQKVNSVVRSMQELTALDTELREDDTWKQIIRVS